MNADETLTRTFADHEHLAPDANAALADLHRHLDGRRRRNTTRALTTLGAAATVAAVAVGVTVLADNNGSHHSAATPGGKRTSTHALVNSKPAKPPQVAPTAPDQLSIGAGWLPGKITQDQEEAQHGPDGEQRGYLVKVGGTSMDVLLRVDHSPALPSESPQSTGGAPANDITVNGRAAREWVNGGVYVAAFKADGGAIGYVYLDPASGANSPVYSDASLTTVGRHIASSMQFNRHDKIGISAVLTYVPAGVTITSLETMRNGTGYSKYTLSSPGSRDTAQVDVGGTGGGVPPGIGKAGRPVQGHRTETVHNSNGTFELAVYNFRPGVSISLSTGGDVTTLAQLYRIADGIHWVG